MKANLEEMLLCYLRLMSILVVLFPSKILQ